MTSPVISWQFFTHVSFQSPEHTVTAQHAELLISWYPQQFPLHGDSDPAWALGLLQLLGWFQEAVWAELGGRSSWNPGLEDWEWAEPSSFTLPIMHTECQLLLRRVKRSSFNQSQHPIPQIMLIKSKHITEQPCWKRKIVYINQNSLTMPL